MFVETKEVIDRPLMEVFTLVRDELPKLVPFLPNIESVQVQKREQIEHNNTISILNYWYAKIEIPSVAESFVKKELFAWKDYAIWKNDQYCVEYKLESFWAKDLFDAKGVNYFRAINDHQTELRLTCDVVLHPEKVPGVPQFLVKKVLPYVEPLVLDMLKPNLNGLGIGLKKYFAQKKD